LQPLAVAGPYSGGNPVTVAKFGTPQFGSTAQDRVDVLLGSITGTDFGRINVYAPGGGGMAMNLGVWNGTAIADIITLTKSGNVGIGTASPAYKLHVCRPHGDMLALQSSDNSRSMILGHNGDVSYLTYASGDDFHIKGTSGANLRLVISNLGNVGIGPTMPSEKLDVSGTVRCVNVVQTSDEQLKTDVRPLEGVLDKLDRVRAVSFQWNEKARALGARMDVRQIGVLAQNMEQVFPELVTMPDPAVLVELSKRQSEQTLTAQARQQFEEEVERVSYKAVDYSQLTVVLLEAVKELQAQNRSLEQRVQALENAAR